MTASKRSTALETLDCPNCGGPIFYIAGITHCLLCPACRGESQLSSVGAELVQMHSMMQVKTTTFPLGRVAHIPESTLNELFSDYEPFKQSKKSSSASTEQVRDYTIIGMLCFKEVGENNSWTEYLLHSKAHGFLSLIESLDGWFIAQLLDKPPVKKRGNLIFCEKIWRGYDTYQSAITYAVGAFNWQVNLTDNFKVTDYRKQRAFITKKQREKSFVYQLAVRIRREQAFGWFAEPMKSTGSTQSEILGALFDQLHAKEISDEEFFKRAWEIIPPKHTIQSQKYRDKDEEDDDEDGYSILIDEDESIETKLVKVTLYAFVTLLLVAGLKACEGNASYYSSGRSGFSSYGSHK